jgi:phosphatidate cytidylyltransferase
LARGDARKASGTLRLRIISAFVLAPVPLAAVWFGGPFLPIVTIAAGSVMAWEWGRLCGSGRWGTGGAALVGVVAAAVAAAALAGLGAGAAVAAAGAALVWLVEVRRDGEPGWMAAGTLWVALPCIILLWLAQSEHAGRVTLLWIFAVVWATDIGAYAVGRWLGGPLLAPRWSPRKTWAGLAGGIGCAAIAAWALAWAVDVSPARLVPLSAGLAIVEQFGDLAESVAKRRFGVKDASGLIPGHGGLLDRLDGLLAVIPAVALLTLIAGGSVVTWR